MEQEALAVLVGSVFSFGLEVIPGLNDLWVKVPTKWKALVMLGLFIVIPAILVGLACAGVVTQTGYYCPVPLEAQDVYDLLKLSLLAFAASQVSFAKLGGAELGARYKLQG